MKTRIMMVCATLIICGALDVRAQQTGAAPTDTGMEQRATLDAQTTALDSSGRAAISGQLLTRALDGTPDAPIKNVRFIIENRSGSFYNYVTGSVTFYDERNVRCGEGQFTLNALAPNEQAETDAPGLRLSCSPRTWRLVANNLLTRTSDVAKPSTDAVQPEAPSTADAAPAPAMMTPLEITVDDKVYNAPLGSTLEVPVRRRRVRITVRPAQ